MNSKLLLIGLAWLPLCLIAAPRVPLEDREVLEHLPKNRVVGHTRGAVHSSFPTDDLTNAVARAWQFVQLSRAEGDPRPLGRAQAILAPWWDQTNPPPEVRLLRATLRQSLHDFPAALADLNALVLQDPQNTQAWLTKATVHTVRGEWKEARRAAVSLTGLSTRLVSATVAGSIASLNGQAEEAYDLIQKSLQQDRSSPSAVRAWSITTLAEIAHRLDRPVDAEAHFRRALSLEPDDVYALGAFADFLLQRGRPSEVVPLLAGREAVDGLLLRQVLALAALPSASKDDRATNRLREYQSLLQARFDAARARGESVHQREEARFVGTVLRDPARALLLAQENWKIQREPADLRILVECARAASDTTTLREARRWIEESELFDATLAPLLKVEEAHR